MVTVGLLATPVAKPGKADDVASFLAGAPPLALTEDGVPGDEPDATCNAGGNLIRAARNS
jgi:hypothetical protein